jgi:hypothetical protein
MEFQQQQQQQQQKLGAETAIVNMSDTIWHCMLQEGHISWDITSCASEQVHPR